MKVVCAQIGSRQNYEIPALINHRNELCALVTDFWNPIGSALPGAKFLPASFKRALLRRRAGIPVTRVRTDLRLALEFWRIQRRTTEWGGHMASLLARFAQFTAKCTRRVEHDTLFVFCGAALEAIEYEKSVGNAVVLDQYDTGPELGQTLAEEALRYPKWRQVTVDFPPWHYERLRREWELADRILVNSSWTRKWIVQSGVPETKISIVPLSIDPPDPLAKPKRRSRNKLRVLWLGRLCLGKGLAYALEAARLVRGLPVEFTFVGSASLDRSAIDWPDNCRVQEHVDRAQVDALYAAHDVFLFPTLSDGFGRVQLEAARNGLVVVATSHCGEVVQDGVSGFVIPARDAKAIADRLITLSSSSGLLEEMSSAALQRSKDFGISCISPSVVSVLSGVVS